MTRPPGVSVRVRLALSYAAIVVVAGVVLLAVVWIFLLRYVPPEATVRGGDLPGAFYPGRDDLLRAFAPPAVASLVGLLVLGLVGGWFLAGRMLVPLQRITAATRLAAQGSLAHRIALDGPGDEFRELADSFDAMLARIEAQVAEQRRFAANASHELRTPLAITQTMLEVARADPDRDVDELLGRLQSVNTRAIDLTEALLVLGRADRRAFEVQRVDLALLVEDAIETTLPLAEQRGVPVDAVADRAVVLGSPALLRQLVVNLLHNAIVHNRTADGWISVRLAAAASGGAGAVLIVENSGQALDAAVVATLAEPFQRGAERTRGDDTGVGLGLAIVQSIVRAHDGELDLQPRVGGGLRVRVTLP